ncbi:MAG TPA: prolyl oligopeptidase family serine peptidase [Fimbriimonadaceae bacterium]|nr:prolyl oligopeptidase family serine peptidase [Fimbriimonadaceae bacterium]
MLLASLVLVALRPADIPLLSGLGISEVSQGGRAPVGIDTVQSQIVAGQWKEPHAGDKVPAPRGGEREWTAVTANKNGTFDGGPANGGYIDCTADSDSDKPMLLVAAGDTLVYINGVIRAGDPYGYGYLKIPFEMKKGHNEFLFLCGRGSLKASLTPVDAPQMLNTGDMTLPDILVGEHQELLGAIPVVNSEDREASNLEIGAQVGDGKEVRTKLPRIGAMTLRKCPFHIGYGDLAPGDVPLKLNLYRGGKLLHSASTTISVRKPVEHYKRTFVSQIDGSVQYYAVCPALKPSKDNALILTVHGASVEAIGQARAYQPKDWCTIVAPTNRRPFGFDWEDWGRMDAMEVWNIAKKEFPHDPKRVILTGHSMGGHGTWTLGLTFPNEFAAIGPSAGWISFWSYAGGWTPKEPNAVETMLRRSMNSSDTLLMLNNAKMEDIYILHGDKDDNVPVEQAREMKQRLTDIGAKFEYHEQPGAGHWWGNQCVDWPPMFEMFDKARYEYPDKFEFTTVNPGVSASCRGITIDEQIDPLLPSKVAAARQADGTWSITTENVAKLSFDTSRIDVLPSITIDGAQELRAGGNDSDARKVMSVQVRNNGSWIPDVIRDKDGKSPERSGPFKLAFQNRFVLVVGTHGTPGENAWAANKARYDAESWAYRGNGAVDVIRDDEVGKYKDRNLILYGNADTNSAFKLVAKCPMQLKRDSVEIGGHSMKGEDFAALYLYPQGSRMIGVVGGTGLAGLRYTDRLPYFTSGVAYPDWTILPTSVLTKGSKAVSAAGFFGNDWQFDEKQSAFETR